MTEYVAPTFPIFPVALVPVPEHVASTVTLVTPDPAIEDVAPALTVSFNQAIEYVESAPGITHATPAPEIDDVAPAPSLSSTAPAPVIEYVTPAPAHPVIDYVASSPVNPNISLALTATFAAPSQKFSPVATMADQVVGIPAPSTATEMEMAKVTGVLCAAPVPMIELVTPSHLHLQRHSFLPPSPWQPTQSA